ncbi:conserved hypothetical protein [Solidesulfovibrio fructosivorans JJ]]|uniref:Uncharacterized protein n=1 Tax=Solidesulfovibrio fructosivorans JJ] TaxID=596151 RepID=E1JR45_SOLFR|nr:hypothetical protein [Solidesulfovibrio fructosivorans]EFL53046.1 conserved hypothetical protein [Solidesulfovibrio fructosivorans JJ]]
MTARSRLGRDPLSGVTQPEAKKTTKATTKSTAKKAAPQKTAKPKPAKVGTTAKKTAPAKQQPTPVAQSAPEKSPVEPRPISESVLTPDAPPETVVAAGSRADTEIQPVPQSSPVIAPKIDPATAGEIPEPRATETVAPVEPTMNEASLDMADTLAVKTAASAVPPAEAIQPIPQSMPMAESTSQAALMAEPACPPLPTDGPPPAEVFLRGVVEGLAPAGGLVTDVEVDPDTSALPVEKLFYFSHVLQLLVSPLERPAEPGRKPGDKRGPVPALSVRLRTIGQNRHSLRIYDNGLFFGRYLPDVSLDMEALRPLLLFVIKRNGSILLKQGKGVEFEIIG